MKRLHDIHIDLDGVLFDLDKGYEEKWGYKPGPADGPKDPQFWKNIMGDPRFFADLPLMEDAELLVATFKALQAQERVGDVCILTACSDTWYDSVRSQKIEAVERYWPDLKVHTVRKGQHKARYASHPTHVLIDDTHTNINLWRKAGGTGVLYRSFEDAMPNIRRIFK